MKMERFETDPFLVWKVKTKAFENGDEKSPVVYCRFRQRLRGVFQCGRWAETHEKYAFSINNEIVWTGDSKTKTLMVTKIFSIEKYFRKRIL